LLAAARRLFARKGYTATSLDDVTGAANMTKGAFYHHFQGKSELFEAVFEQEERKLCEAMTTAFLAKRDPWAGFAAGSRAFLEASLDRGVQRITLIDAPIALGYKRMHEIQARYTLALMKQGLRAAIDAGRVRKRELDPLANVLFGGMCQALTFVVESDDQRAAVKKIQRELKAVLDGLAVPPDKS
jgi:AcrR family transcriptional regulator